MEAVRVAGDSVPILAHLVQVHPDVHVASGRVGLHVEGLGHRLRRGVELELHFVPVAIITVNAQVDCQGVVGADHKVLYRELHAVVARLDLRHSHPRRIALPVGAHVLAVVVRHVHPVLWIAVIPFPVPLIIPAIQARPVRAAVVELQRFWST